MNEVEAEVPLLTVLPLIQSVVHACRDKEGFPYSKMQMYVFTMLSLKGSLTMKEIARYTSSTNEYATRAVAPLVDDGYVERFVLPQNRQHIHIRLTEKGRAYLSERTRALGRRVNAALAEKLSDTEQEELRTAVRTIIRILG